MVRHQFTRRMCLEDSALRALPLRRERSWPAPDFFRAVGLVAHRRSLAARGNTSSTKNRSQISRSSAQRPRRPSIGSASQIAAAAAIASGRASTNGVPSRRVRRRLSSAAVLSGTVSADRLASGRRARAPRAATAVVTKVRRECGGLVLDIQRPPRVAPGTLRAIRLASASSGVSKTRPVRHSSLGGRPVVFRVAYYTVNGLPSISACRIILPMSSTRLHLKQAREGRGWSQLDLAEHAGVRQATISEIETGKARRISLDVLDRLAKALGVTASELFEGSPPAKRARR